MLASSGDYDSAVYRAVEQSDVDVLLYALDAVGIDKVRTMSPLPFGQLTLLCLVQQLGTTLARDDAVDFKLEWLQPCSASTRPTRIGTTPRQSIAGRRRKGPTNGEAPRHLALVHVAGRSARPRAGPAPLPGA